MKLKASDVKERITNIFAIDRIRIRSKNRHENWYIYIFFNIEGLYDIYFAVIRHYMALQMTNFYTDHP